MCDDGNRDEDDGCTSLCAPPVCGDGVVSPAEGENCDDGNPNNDDGCPNDCTQAICGDGELEGTETCDEAGLNGDGVSLCSDDCTLNVCGDGYLVPELEACDDGDATGDGVSLCTPQCTLNVCGDGYQHLSTESCDAGEDNGFVPCSTTTCAVVPEVTQIAYSGYSACAVYSDGAVRCWGSNGAGRLAIVGLAETEWIGDAPGEMPPPQAELGGPVQTVATGSGPGGDSWCALRFDGSVVCWGAGRASTSISVAFYSGLLGPFSDEQLAEDPIPNVGDDLGELPPTPIPLGIVATDISVGDTSACAVSESGTLHCWGYTRSEIFDVAWPTLGYGALTHRAAPSDFPPPAVNLGVEVTNVNHRRSRTCTLGVDQQLRCFGASATGRLGLAGTGPTASGIAIAPPVTADVGGPVVELGTGRSSLCARLEDGTGRCFGWNGDATLGTGSEEHVGDQSDELPPSPIDLGPTPITKLVGGSPMACALFENGAVRCWGGQARTYGYEEPNEVYGDEPGEMPPPEINLDGLVVDLFTGRRGRACVIYEDRSVACWGADMLGLGVGGYLLGDNPGEMPPPRLRLYD